MKGHCNTKGHTDNPHRKRVNCVTWQGTHQLPITPDYYSEVLDPTIHRVDPIPVNEPMQAADHQQDVQTAMESFESKVSPVDKQEY